MRSFFCLLILIIVGCGEISTEYKPLDISPLPSCSSKYNGIYATVNDSVFLCKDSSWLYQSFTDTVLIEIKDTSIVYENIPLYGNNLVVNKCRTEFDNPFIPGKSFFFGNSLVGGFETFGMAASDSTKDYIANLTNYFKSKDIFFLPQKKSSNFENMLTIEEQNLLLYNEILPRIDSTTGLIVIQLGDNVNEEGEFINFKESIANLLNQICGKSPKAKVIWIGEWYSSEAKQKAIKEMTDLFKIDFVDISDINIPEKQSQLGAVYTYPNTRDFSMTADSIKEINDSLHVYFTIDEVNYQSTIVTQTYQWNKENKSLSWIGKQNIITNPFIASHPNDKAFAEISERIISALGYEP